MQHPPTFPRTPSKRAVLLIPVNPLGLERTRSSGVAEEVNYSLPRSP